MIQFEMWGFMRYFDVFSLFMYLVMNLVIGTLSSKGKLIKNIRDYALAGRKFDMHVLAATIAATWIGGSTFAITISRAYSHGLIFFFQAGIGDFITLCVVGFLISPRLGIMAKSASIAEALGNVHGLWIRKIVAGLGIVACLGVAVTQFRVFGNIFQYFTGIPSELSMIVAALTVTIYSAYGGIRAVTFTDVLQFYTFMLAVPLIASVIWKEIGSPTYELIDIVRADPVFNIKPWSGEFWAAVALFGYNAVPGIQPPYFQRMAMARDAKQARMAFFISAVAILSLNILLALIAILLRQSDPGIAPDQIVTYFMDKYSYPGFKGMLMICITAMVMSTADSNINSGVILIINDLLKKEDKKEDEGVVGSELEEDGPQLVNAATGAAAYVKADGERDEKGRAEIRNAHYIAIGFGVVGLVVAMVKVNLLSLIMFGIGFYMSGVSVPFLYTIFGLRPARSVVLSGIALSLCMYLVWRWKFPDIDPTVPTMAAHLAFVLVAHAVTKLLRLTGAGSRSAV